MEVLLDGIKFYYKSGTGTAARSSNGGGGAPKIPKRDYLSKMFRSKLNISNQSHHEQSPQQLTNGSGGETYCFSWERNWELLGIHFQSNEYITFSISVMVLGWMQYNSELIKEESHQCLVMLMEDIYLHSMRQMMILKLLECIFI